MAAKSRATFWNSFCSSVRPADAKKAGRDQNTCLLWESKHYHFFCTPNNFKVSLNSHEQFRVSAAETISLFLGAIVNCADTGQWALGGGFLRTKQTQGPSYLCPLNANYVARPGQGQHSPRQLSLHLTRSVLQKYEDTVLGPQRSDTRKQAKNKVALRKQHLKFYLDPAFGTSCFICT